MKTKLFVLPLLGMLASVLAYWGWNNFGRESSEVFECQAHLHLPMAVDTCQGESNFDFFLALHGDAKGYLIIEGKYACPNNPPTFVDSIVDFTYKQEGAYRAIHLGPRSADLTNIFSVLKYDEIKLKITPLDKGLYLLDLPLRTPLVCRKKS